MRSSFSSVLAALAVVAVLPAPAAAAGPSLAACRWEPRAHHVGYVPRALAAAPDGSVLLAADDLTDPARPRVRVLRGTAGGSDWQLVDSFLPAGAAGSGARALHVDADGNAFLLAWVQTATGTDLVLRRSLGGGAAGTWEAADERWPFALGGALTSDPDGRIYVAYGFAGPAGIGWRVVSALRGIGSFRVDDEFRPTGGRIFAAEPLDLERAANGVLIVAGQLDGEPDEWVVRQRRMRPNGRPGQWQTIDRYKLSATSYGLLPRAVVPLAGGGVLAVGAGVPGGNAHDYRWLERRRQATGSSWSTNAYQLVSGQHTQAHDAVAAGAGLATVGIGQTPTGNRLQLRESANGGRTWTTIMEVAGVDPTSARIAGRGQGLWIAAVIEGAAVVIGCDR